MGCEENETVVIELRIDETKEVVDEMLVKWENLILSMRRATQVSFVRYFRDMNDSNCEPVLVDVRGNLMPPPLEVTRITARCCERKEIQGGRGIYP